MNSEKPTEPSRGARSGSDAPHRVRKRPLIGDVIEFPLPNGKLAYAHYVKEHTAPPGLGSLVRILPGQFSERPADLAGLAAREELWLTFLPLSAACRRDNARVVGSADVPKSFERWPLFKAYNQHAATGKKTWFLWDGKIYKQVGELPRDCFGLSFPETINLTELDNRIVSGWTPADEV